MPGCGGRHRGKPQGRRPARSGTHPALGPGEAPSRQQQECLSLRRRRLPSASTLFRRSRPAGISIERLIFAVCEVCRRARALGGCPVCLRPDSAVSVRYGPAAPTRIRPNSDGAGWLSGAGPVSLDLNDPAMAVQARCRKVVTPFIGVSKDGVTTWGGCMRVHYACGCPGLVLREHGRGSGARCGQAYPRRGPSVHIFISLGDMRQGE